MGLHHKRQPHEFLLIPGTKVSTYGGIFGRLQYRGEAERAKVSFFVASVAEQLIFPEYFSAIVKFPAESLC